MVPIFSMANPLNTIASLHCELDKVVSDQDDSTSKTSLLSHDCLTYA